LLYINFFPNIFTPCNSFFAIYGVYRKV
jgi:hypothetical protein